MRFQGLRFDGSRFWVTHRHREYGPFDYEWSRDFDGVELVYQGRKFGEYCSESEIFADLKEFKLPMSVVEVASITLGSIIHGVLNGRTELERETLIAARLREHGYGRFAPGDDAA